MISELQARRIKKQRAAFSLEDETEDCLDDTRITGYGTNEIEMSIREEGASGTRTKETQSRGAWRRD